MSKIVYTSGARRGIGRGAGGVGVGGWPGLLKWFAAAALLVLALSSSWARADDAKDPPPPNSPSKSAADAPKTVTASPSGRVARNIAIITIEGPIDEWTLYSVKRRMAQAQKDGADAIVFDIDSPGGEVFSCVLIATEIKRSAVPMTVAWVNPKAYSGGAVLAMACKEMVIGDAAVVGDVLPISTDGAGNLRRIGREEREKFMAPVMADLVDSARQNGYDEEMVQAFVRRGVELWLVEHTKTGQRLFVSRDEYIKAVGEEPDASTPTVPRGLEPAPKPRRPRPGEGGGGAKEKTDFSPAAPGYSSTLIGDVNTELSLKSIPGARPSLNDPEHAGMYRPLEYVTDGSAPLTLRETELTRYRIATAKVRTDDELRRLYGATNLARLNENWADHTARFLSLPPVKIFLIVVFLVALFVEMMHPGLSLPGGIAAVCLVALVLPPILAGIAGWWTLGAIVLGIGLVCVEIFVTPGVAIIGVIGVLMLFVGLVGTFLVGPSGTGGAGGGIFPGSAKGSGEIAWAVASTFVALLTAAILISVLLRFLPRMPMLNKLVLSNAPAEDPEPGAGAYTPSFGPDHPIKAGMTGTAITPLRPVGRVEIGERIVEAVTDGTFIDAGAKVRVISASGFRTMVAQAEN